MGRPAWDSKAQRFLGEQFLGERATIERAKTSLCFPRSDLDDPLDLQDGRQMG
jgi:hypothetical protein